MMLRPLSFSLIPLLFLVVAPLHALDYSPLEQDVWQTNHFTINDTDGDGLRDAHFSVAPGSSNAYAGTNSSFVPISMENPTETLKFSFVLSHSYPSQELNVSFLGTASTSEGELNYALIMGYCTRSHKNPWIAYRLDTSATSIYEPRFYFLSDANNAPEYLVSRKGEYSHEVSGHISWDAQAQAFSLTLVSCGEESQPLTLGRTININDIVLSASPDSSELYSASTGTFSHLNLEHSTASLPLPEPASPCLLLLSLSYLSFRRRR